MTMTMLSDNALLYEGELGLPLAERQILQCLRYLAGMSPDRISERNGAGFSKVHVKPGRDFASLYKDRGQHLSERQMDYAFKIVRTYTRQLNAAGLIVPQETDAKTAVENARSRDMERMASRQAAQEQLAQAAFTPAPTRKAQDCLVTLEPGMEATLAIYFPYNQTLISKMYVLKTKRDQMARKNRHIGYVQFTSIPDKRWIAPIELLGDILETFPGFSVSDDVQRLVEEREREARRIQELLEAKERADQERILALYAALGDLTRLLRDGTKLYLHQIEAIETLINWQSGILAHDMGLGKTKSACLLTKAYSDAYQCRVLVVGPKTLRINWLREASMVGLNDLEYYTYERIPTLEDMQSGMWAGRYVLFIDEAHAFQTMEAQRTKKAIPLAWGSLATVAITGTPIKNGRPINIYPLLLMCKHPLVYAETPEGEPNQARIKELKTDYVRRYCASTESGSDLYIDKSGAIRLDELHRMIVGSERGVIRKRKDQCLDLPKKIRKFVPAELSPEEVQAYYAALDAMWDSYQYRLEQKLELFKATALAERVETEMAAHIAEYGAPESEEEFAALYTRTEEKLIEFKREQWNSGEALVNLNFLRQAGSAAKTAHAIDMAREIFEQDEEETAEAAIERRVHKPAQVVIFTAFVESAQRIAAALNCGIISGDTKDSKRQQYIDDFQANKSRAIVCIYGAGGVGITLTKANYVILVDRPWTPGDTEQAEDRSHRIGQDSDVLAIWVQLPDYVSPIDQKIDSILLQKQERVLKTLDGQLDNLPPDILFKNIAKALVDEVISFRRNKVTD